MKGIIVNVFGGLELNDEGRRVVARGGADGVSDDEMLLLEVISRAPNMSIEDAQALIMAVMEDFGDDALRAIRTGHLQIKPAEKLDG